MGAAEECTFYEELRKRNVERNENVMHMLGLASPTYSFLKQQERVPGRTGRIVSSVPKSSIEPRRSGRLALLNHKSMAKDQKSVARSAHAQSTGTSSKIEVPYSMSEEQMLLQKEGQVQEVQDGKKKMEDFYSGGDDYSTDASSDSFYGEHVNMDVDIDKRNRKEPELQKTSVVLVPPLGNAISNQLGTVQGVQDFGAQLQEMVMRAVMQSTATLIGSSPTLIPIQQLQCMENALVRTEAPFPASTWTEGSYNKVEARRKRKAIMTRTSAGENSDSQEDLPIPENETPQQKSVRTRRLNKLRVRRATELTSNRKGFNKLPYVIHVDGTGKARGIHKHQWRAAMRGQCGRLDPTMDNINHHPKHVVNSIWHALEKEWEFQGFTHRAREMFERSATKFMRNRKMQLKYKCQKNEESSKPADVSDAHWSKIVDLTKKTSKQMTCTSSGRSTPKGKNIEASVQEDRKPPLQLMWNENQTPTASLDCRRRIDSVNIDAEDVDARIRGLQMELQRLQQSKKDCRGKGYEQLGPQSSTGADNEDCFAMKENMKPGNGIRNVQLLASSEISTRRTAVQREVNFTNLVQGSDFTAMVESLPAAGNEHSLAAINNAEIECGDVIHMVSIRETVQTKVGKGIVMGLSGSKYARKKIPKGWRSIKITSYTFIGSEEACPIPTGWADQLKHQTVKEACGHTVVWPDILLRNLLHK